MKHNHKNIAIIYLGDCFYDARCINMVHSLLKEGFVISVIHNSLIDNTIPSIFNRVQFYNTKIKKNSLTFYWKFYSQVRALLKKNNFDVLIAGDLYSLANICKHKKKSYLVYDCREIYSELSAHNKQPIKKYLLSLYENYFIKFIDSVLVTAKSDLDFLKSKYVKHKHIQWYVIYNFPFAFKQNGCAIDLHKKYNISKNQKLLLYQGVIQENRGIASLIQLVQQTKILTAIIIGDGPALNQYKKFVLDNNLNNKVFFINQVPYLNLLSYTASCDIGWLLIKGTGISNQFALPNKLFEYTLMGLPVLSSNLPNMKSLIQKNDFGLCVDENNITDQINSIMQIIQHYGEYQMIAKQTASKYVWDVQHNKFIDAINK